MLQGLQVLVQPLDGRIRVGHEHFIVNLQGNGIKIGRIRVATQHARGAGQIRGCHGRGGVTGSKQGLSFPKDVPKRFTGKSKLATIIMDPSHAILRCHGIGVIIAERLRPQMQGLIEQGQGKALSAVCDRLVAVPCQCQAAAKATCLSRVRKMRAAAA